MTQRDRDRLVALKQARKRQITQKQAAEQLQCSERHVRRLPAAFYTDKASLFQTAPKIMRDQKELARDEREPLPPTQIGRALRELGIVWTFLFGLDKGVPSVFHQLWRHVRLFGTGHH